MPYLPNTITLFRIAAAPVLILLLKERDYALALLVFVLAGASDGLDGWIAKRFNMQSRLGGILDPLADKLLLVSAYVMLTVLDRIPFWLLLTVAFRDLLIIGGYLVYVMLSGPVHMRPSRLSKFNTFMQIALVLAVLAQEAAAFVLPGLREGLIVAVAATTIASGAHYIWVWLVRREVERVVPGTRDE